MRLPHLCFYKFSITSEAPSSAALISQSTTNNDIFLNPEEVEWVVKPMGTHARTHKHTKTSMLLFY